MSLSMRAVCFALASILGLLTAGPVAAQEVQMAMNRTSHAASAQASWGAPTGLLKYCGARFVCYTGIPLHCAANTRPYQNIAEHKCLCVHDGCPQ